MRFRCKAITGRRGTALGIALSAFAAAAIPAPVMAQQGAAELKRPVRDLFRSVVRPARPALRPAEQCGAADIIGKEGSEGIIGEKRPEGIIGEKGREGIIGEKQPAGIIGEKHPAESGAQVFENSWDSDSYTTFRHVLQGRPGRVKLTLDACTSASGGETVAVYLMDPSGARKTGWRLFVIGTRKGNSRSGTLVLPAPARGQAISKLPIMVVVENASGRSHTGSYRLAVTR